MRCLWSLKYAQVQLVRQKSRRQSVVVLSAAAAPLALKFSRPSDKLISSSCRVVSYGRTARNLVRRDFHETRRPTTLPPGDRARPGRAGPAGQRAVTNPPSIDGPACRSVGRSAQRHRNPTPGGNIRAVEAWWRVCSGATLLTAMNIGGDVYGLLSEAAE